MSNTAVQHAKGVRRRRLLLLLVVGLFILLATHTGVDFWASRSIDTEIARLEQRYGTLDAATLVLPPVPADDNRARVVRAAAALAVPVSTEVQQATFRYVGKDEPFPVPAAVREFADANRRAVAMADEVRSRTQSSWEADPRTGTNQPGLLEVRTLANAIYVSALLDVEAGRADQAANTLSSGLAVAASMRQEPQLVAQLVRVAVTMIVCEAVEQVIVGAEPSKTVLAELARWLVENREPVPMTVGLLGEMKFANAGLITFETGGDTHLQGIRTDHPRWSGLPGRLVSRPLIRLARLRYLKTAGGLLDVQMSARPRAPFPEQSPPAFWDLPGKLERTFTAGLHRSIETGDTFASVLAATEIGVALRRFRLEHSRYPDDLSMLVPEYLDRMPVDTFTGKPPVYARTGAGFTLHAEGDKNYSLIKSALDWTVKK